MRIIIALFVLLFSDYVVAAVSTVGQPPFLVDACSEKQITWPEGSLVYCKDTSALYQLVTGAYVQMSGTNGKLYEGITLRTGSFPIYKSGTVASGSAIVYLTNDNTAGGVTACPNGVVTDSVQAVVNDSAALYPMGWAFTNSNKTLTITTNKSSSTGVIALLGIPVLGAPVAAANGSVIKVQVWCY